MHRMFIICGIIAIAAAASIPEDAQARVLNYENENDGKGNYRFSFQTSNGITREESGRLVNIGEPDEHIVVEGTYSYLDSNGVVVTINYTADENGYAIGEPQKLPPGYVEYSDIGPHVLASLLGK